MTIRTRLALALAIGTFVPLLIVGYMGIGMFHDAILKFAINQLESLSSSRKEQLHTFFTDESANINSIMTRQVLRGSLTNFVTTDDKHFLDVAKHDLDSAITAIKNFQNISVIYDGQVVTSTNDRLIGLSSSAVKCDYHAQHAKGEAGVDLSHFYKTGADSLRNKVVAKMQIGSGKSVYICADADANAIVKIGSNYTGLGSTGEIVIAQKDDNGNAFFLINTRNGDNTMLRKVVPKEVQIPITWAINGKSGVDTGYHDYQNIAVTASYKAIEEFDIGLVVKINKDELAHYYREFQYFFYLILFVLLILVLMTLYAIEINIFNPLNKVTEFASNIGKEGADKECDVISSDEIGILANALNKTLKTLDDKTEELWRLNSTMTMTIASQTEALRRGLEELETVFATTRDGLAILDLETNFLYTNEAYAKLTGYEVEELKKKSCLELTAPEDRKATMQALQKTIDEGFIENFPKRCLVKDGSKISVAMSLSLLPDKKSIVASVKDMTELLKREFELQKSRQNMRTVFDSSHEAIIVYDKDGKLLDINKKAVEIFEFASFEEALMLKYPDDLSSNDCPTALESLPDIHQKVLNGEKMMLEWRLRKRHTDSCMDMDVFITKVYFGEEDAILAIIKDMTEQKRQQKELAEVTQNIENLNKELSRMVAEEVELNRQKDRMLLLQSRHAAMGEMISNIAHQWRQPLNNLGLIIQSINLAFRQDKLTPDGMNKYTERGTGLIEHMSKTIDDFRDFFKPEKAEELFSIKEIAAKALELIDQTILQKGLALNVKMDDNDDALILGYPNELQQVILNIISNAQDAVLEQKIENPTISVSLKKDGDTALLSISDNGGGVPEDIKEKIFDPYFTTKEEGKGTGIGLYMSKTIIEKNMDGLLTVHNNGSGAVFEISLKAANSNV